MISGPEEVQELVGDAFPVPAAHVHRVPPPKSKRTLVDRDERCAPAVPPSFWLSAAAESRNRGRQHLVTDNGGAVLLGGGESRHGRFAILFYSRRTAGCCQIPGLKKAP